MTKITGNEPVNPTIKSINHKGIIEVTSDYDGIPIRLHIAAMIFNGLVAAWGQHDCTDYSELADDAIMAADKLISAYNKNHNPNE